MLARTLGRSSFSRAALILTVIFVVLLFLGVKVTHAQSSSCTTYYTSNVAVPTGYGAAYNLFTVSHEPLIAIDCTTSTPKLTVGSNLTNQYSYNQSYVYQNGSWQQHTLTGTNLANNAWYPGLASGSLPAPTSSWTYVVGYVCQWSGSAWQCGCHDTQCSTGMWQLQAYEAPQQASGGGGAAAGTRNWAFFNSNGTETAQWTSLNSGWNLQPFDGYHGFTAIGSSFSGATGLPWSPTPRSFMMTVTYGTPNGQNYVDMAQAANGAYNATWLSWLQADAAAAVAPVKVVRIWQEINGNWMPWSNGSPATIIAAWRNMAKQVRIAFPHAVIEWNLNAGTGWSGQPGDGSGYDLYPGDDLVDVVGIDAYEKGQTFSQTQSGPGVNLNNLVAFATAHNKLIAWSETAAANCDGNYITAIANFFDSLGARGAYWSYFDEGLSNNGDNILWSVTGTDSCPANTLRAAMNASSFGTKPFGGTWMK